MKTKQIIGIFLFLIATQGLTAQGIDFGFRLGLSSSSIASQEFNLVTNEGAVAAEVPGSVENSRLGISAYFMAGIPITESLSFQPEIGFAALGVKYQPLRIDYLQLPLGLRYDLSQSFYLNVGPQISGKIWFHEQTRNYNYLDFSAFGGLGYMINDNLFIDVRYTIGFTEVYTEEAAVDVLTTVTTEEGNVQFARENRLENLSGKNVYFQFSVGYRL